MPPKKSAAEEGLEDSDLEEQVRKAAEVARLRRSVMDILEDRSATYEDVKYFVTRRVNRLTLESLEKHTSDYHKLDEFDGQLATEYTAWVSKVNEEDLETADDVLAPSKIEALFEEYGDTKDRAVEMFTQLAQNFPGHLKVKEHLKFLTSQASTQDLPPLPASSASSVSEKGESYVKAKIPKVETAVNTELLALQTTFGESVENRSLSLEDIEKGVVKLEKKIGEDSAFDKLLRELHGFEDCEETFEEAETWQENTMGSIKSLLGLVQTERKKTEVKKVQQPKVSFPTLLKKRDPPVFKGDCLEFMDFQRKWKNSVHSSNPPEDFELDLLKTNIPEQGKKKLFGVESLSTAWKLLEKLYGDTKLICQKLKNKLKNLQPKCTEEHEIIIELSDEVDYLVKRLKELDACSLLVVDNDYLNAVYIHLPKYNQMAWDMFDTDTYDNEWQAFMVFMHEISAAALKKRTRIESLKEMEKSVTYKKKEKVATLAATVTEPVRVDSSRYGGGDAQAKQDKIKARLEQEKKKCGKCKCCKGEHSYKNRWNNLWPTDRLFNCKQFADLSPTKRAELLQQCGGCSRCTSWNHQKKECPMAVFVCREKVNSVECKGDHSRMVCNSGVAYVNSLLVKSNNQENGSLADIEENAPTLSYQIDIKIGNGKSCRVLFDGGSNRVLFNNEFARELSLFRRKAAISLNVAGGGQETLETDIYEVDLLDRLGEKHAVWGYGLETIIEPDDPVDMSPVSYLFPHIPGEVFRSLPKKRVDILIGLNFNGLHPSGGEGENCIGNLKVLSTIFGSTGWVLGGSHPLLSCSSLKFSSSVARLRVAKVAVSPILSVEELPEFLPVTSAKMVTTPSSAYGGERLPELLPDYWDRDQLSVLPPRRCEKCRQCADKGKCSEQHQLRTLKEEAELKMISDRVTVVDGHVKVEYPFIKNPGILPPNRPVVVKVAEKLWQGLKKDGRLEEYHAEMRKYIERGTFVKLSKEELEEYWGPLQWITHHGVIKGSVSTPLRVVTNSSFNNHGNSLNSCLPRGPNSLNDLFNITIRFRSYEKVFAYDLAKAYNTMETGIVEKHLRRFVWRWSEDEPWEDYAIDKVHFGDGPAACQLEVSKQKIAEIGSHIDEEAAVKMILDSYVDDNFSGGDPAAIDRMVGKDQSDGS